MNRSLQRDGVLARVTSGFGDLRQWSTIGLCHVENVGCPETDDHFRLLVVIFAAMSDDRRQNRNTLLTLAHEPANAAPGVVTGDAGGSRPLRRDQADVVHAVAMETRHRF